MSFFVTCPDSPTRFWKGVPVAPDWSHPREHQTLQAAIRSARTLCRLHGQKWHVSLDKAGRWDRICVISEDALGRIWTDVMQVENPMI